MRHGRFLILALCIAACVAAYGFGQGEPAAVKIEFLEIVTPEMDATIATLEKVHGVSFGDPVPEFGNARTAPLAGGGRISVRAPMRPDEAPVVRPYILSDKIAAAAEVAEKSGGEIAIPPLEIEGQFTFAIYLQGGNEFGLVQP